jgi:hypothetical protein
MPYIHPAALERERQRWLRPDWQRWVKPEHHHLIAPQAPEEKSRAAAHDDDAAFMAELTALRASHERARRALAELKYELAWCRFVRKYSPDQPRVPAGSRGGGQWTSGGQGPSAPDNPVRLAAEKPHLGRATIAVIAAQVAKRLIEAYRTENMLRDLFGSKNGTVTYTNVNGKDIFGSNSTSPTYSAQDDAAARNMRDVLLQKYPDVMKNDNVGHRPNDALFHAETTLLLRSARENGGTLAGRSLEVFADNPMCASCDAVLPLVGSELGNPTVTFVGPSGATKTMRNGAWID